MASQDNIRPNSFEIFLGTDPAPWMASVGKSEPYDIHPVTTQRFGTSTVAGLVQGHNCELSFDVQEWTLADLTRWNNTLSGAGAVKSLLPAGSVANTIAVRLHNPGDDDTTRDIVLLAVYFHGIALNSDGNRELRTPVRGTATVDPETGEMYRIGYVAP